MSWWPQLRAKVWPPRRLSHIREEPLTDREELNYKAVANALRYRPNAELHRCILCQTLFLDDMGCRCPKEAA